MFYYAVHLPISLIKEFYYTSTQRIPEGSRVLVSFNRKDMIGISGTARIDTPDIALKYKPILEVLDTQPVLDKSLMDIAKWMSTYYNCSMGSACFAMLPAWLIPDVDAEVRWLVSDIPAGFESLASALPIGQSRHISELRKALKGKPVLRLIEQAGASGDLEVIRKLSARDKPKTVNFVKVADPVPDMAVFTARQREAMQMILALGRMEFPLSEISEDISYSLVHALQKKNAISIIPKKIERDFFQYDANAGSKMVVLNSEQEQAVSGIGALREGYSAHLLYGITGSGKTEVYIPLIRDCLKQGKNVIFLIPEIALTPQMVERFQGEFGSILAISHSQLSDRQRLQQWQRIAQGGCRIVIGARSAVFAPMPRLGLIIVDEEHEQTYKQDNIPRYNGRDLAVMRAHLSAAKIVLGSATPSLESWYNQQSGKYTLHSLNSRPLDVKLPEVRILNLGEDIGEQMLSDDLIAAINQRLERKEQVILFQNRRGFSSFMQCLKCGELVKCPNCEISMYYHRDREEMHCHYCGHATPSPRKCPSCGGFSFSYGSPGTQKVEEILHILFPQASVLRLDSDSARRRDAHKSMYRRMKDRDVDILLGTQMISKGLDFPNVTLVGIINADVSLNIPDFRSAERTFQLCTQVAGRAGRADKRGQVIIQTHNPNHYAIVFAGKQDYPGFAAEEMSYRRRLNYPPYYRLARILYQCLDANLLDQEMETLSALSSRLASSYKDGEVYLLGPVPAPFAKLNNYHRQHVIIKGLNPVLISNVIGRLSSDYKPPQAIHVSVDVDPLSLM